MQQGKVLVLHGPNLNLLGTRQPEIYGYDTLDDVNNLLREKAVMAGWDITCLQSNHEGQVIEVHLSNVHKRESFRHHSYVSLRADGVIAGLGVQGYKAALEAVMAASHQ